MDEADSEPCIVAKDDEPGEGTGQKTCFVAMPFAEEFDDIFRYGIKPVVAARGLDCLRVDKDAFVGNIVERMHNMIDRADVVIADMTTSNPNVYYEVGYASRARKQIVLICGIESPLEFNVHGMKCLLYAHIHDLEDQLAHHLDKLLQLGQMR